MKVLELKSHKGNPRNSEGSFIDLQDGRILYAYTHFYGDSWHDNASARLAGRYSSDGGKSWSAADTDILENTEALENIMSVSLLRLQDGRIALLYLRKNSFCDMHPVLRFSSDETKTWTAPQMVVDYQGYFVVNNDRMIQTKNSRLIIPVAFHSLSGKSPGEITPAIGLFFYSDDLGKNWQKSSSWVLPPQNSRTGFQEPGIIELSDGLLMSYFRNDSGAQYTSFSYDNGDIWSVAERNMNFLSPVSPMSMKRNPYTNEIVAVWNDHNPRWNISPAEGSWARTPLVMAFSKDNAKSWERHELIESSPNHGYCYTAIHFVPDGILLAYCCGGGEESTVLQDSIIRKITFK